MPPHINYSPTPVRRFIRDAGVVGHPGASKYLSVDAAMSQEVLG